MHTDHDFRRAIELIKQRAPIEDVVRERVPDLKQRGQRFWACCPFHDEDTPSFSVNAREGFWYCFGACATGGDQFRFLQRLDGLSFVEALEILAARTGVEIPRKRVERNPEDDAGLAALKRAEELFRRELAGSEGRRARQYLARRGLGANTIEAFGLGYAPAGGRAVVGLAGRSSGEGPGLEAFERAGLVRRSDDDGHPYDFFRGRLVIPIRDIKGRTVGFGARRLDDGERSGPKYVNTAETPWFHKGRVVYALDRAIDTVRRGGHLILVEGYTDVMAAHQAGLAHVGAVLGTATTEDHAALVRRAGARRVTLVFDGDEAGRRAAVKALAGLLPLDIDLDVASLPAGSDPCDLILSAEADGGAQAFLAHLELARDWFDFLVQGLEGLTGRELARGVDEVLELFGRVKKPVHRESLIETLAARLGLPVASVREQWRLLPDGRRAASSGRGGPGSSGPEPSRERAHSAPQPARKPVERRVLAAYKGAIGAALLDPSLIPRVRPLAGSCPHPGLEAILTTLLELWEDEDARIDAGSVVTALGEHPVRDHVAGLVEYARRADDPHMQLESELKFLTEHEQASEKRRLQRRIAEMQAAAEAGDDQAEHALAEAERRLNELILEGRAAEPA